VLVVVVVVVAAAVATMEYTMPHLSCNIKGALIYLLMLILGNLEIRILL